MKSFVRLSALTLFVIAALAPAAPAATTNLSLRPVRILCKAISTTNITRSGAQTLDTVSLTTGDIGCLVGESDNKNGAYLVQSGTWKSIDPGVGTGLELYALNGSANVNSVYGCDTTGAIAWGTTSTTFTRKGSGGSVVNATDLYLATATGSAASGKLLLNATASQENLVVTAGSGSRVSIGQNPSTTTATAAVRTVAITLADNGTYDFNNTSFGGSAVVATTNGSIAATVGFSTAAVTTTGGATYSNFSTTLGTSSKLNVAASGGLLRFENKTGGTINIVATITMFVAG